MLNVPSLLRKLKDVPPVRLIVISFFIVIMLGALLLTTPLCSRAGVFTSFTDALFTATSATCVTGLVVVDTWSHWNVFGQIVIITLIQVGGLGVITFTTGFTLLMRRKLGFRDLQLARENTSGDTMNIRNLVKVILGFTFSCEAIGALILMIRFVPKYGLHGIWISVFEAISAYCNAGFDILGFEAPNISMVNYVGDPLVCVTLALLIITGGLGFVVISDIFYSQVRPRIRKEKPGHINFHSQVALITTASLLLLGTVLIFILEFDNTLNGMNFFTKLNASFFQSASARTAGFASIDLGREHDVTKILTIMLMFIGASPAGTGGGIKTTTFVVLMGTVFSVMRGSEDTIIRRRRLEKGVVYRSLTIFTGAAFTVLLATAVVLSTNSGVMITGVDAFFEATSAFSTTGLTAGITQMLSDLSKNTLSLTMFIGRVGPVSLVLAITMRKGRKNAAILPEGKIIVG